MRIGDPLRELVAERAFFRCEYCHYPEEFSPSSIEVEHIIPQSAGGATKLYTLLWLVHIVTRINLIGKKVLTR